MGFATAIFDNAGIDMTVLDHHGVVEHGHVSHAAVAVSCIEVSAKHGILLGCRRGRTHMADHVGVAFGDSAHGARWRKICSDDADGYAGPAALAGGPVGDGL